MGGRDHGAGRGERGLVVHQLARDCDEAAADGVKLHLLSKHTNGSKRGGGWVHRMCAQCALLEGGRSGHDHLDP